jgi:hypothetical protein
MNKRNEAAFFGCFGEVKKDFLLLSRYILKQE